jgi:hypothetical protein
MRERLMETVIWPLLPTHAHLVLLRLVPHEHPH